LPVAESKRRLPQARKRAPKLEAGEGSDDCGLAITKEGKRKKVKGKSEAKANFYSFNSALSSSLLPFTFCLLPFIAL
jgi:hypothetical protein